MAELNEVLRATRETNHLTRQAVRKFYPCHYIIIHDIEAGLVPISESVVEAYAEATNVAPSEIYSRVNSG